MPERGFVRTAPSGSLFATARQGFSVIAQGRVLSLLLMWAIVAGAASEGVDRLWEAHLLVNFSIPALGNLSPVTWFGILEAGGLIVGQGDAFGQAFGGLFLGAIGSWLSLRAAIVTSAALMLPGIGLLQLMRTSQRDRTPRAFVSMQ
jgi:hypothetical protein